MKFLELQRDPITIHVTMGIKDAVDRLQFLHQSGGLPFSFWPHVDVKLNRMSSSQYSMRIDKRIGRFGYSAATGELNQDDDEVTVTFRLGNSYRGSLYMIPLAIAGVIGAILGNLIALIMVGAAIINFLWALYPGADDLGKLILWALHREVGQRSGAGRHPLSHF